ncbi:MAG: adaptor protein MecA [Lachnospiraceae bacterium]|nr:adaptor protein MecA [Lachnospiraceae bacterium]
MHIEEVERYKVACHVSRKDLRLHGIMVEDLVNRTPLGRMFIGKASELSKDSTEYDWPGCAFSMQMEFYPDDIILIFSERIDDYIYNLRQTEMTLPQEQAEEFGKMINLISMSEEEEARRIIRNFEKNVREIQ